MSFDDSSPTVAEAIGTPCIDGTALSATDVQRAAEKVAVARDTLRRAIYAVAGHASDAEECRSLFDMIGVDRASVLSARRAGLRF